jgi:hypothetical protein
VNRLACDQVPTQHLLGHEDVLEHIRALAGLRVPRHPDHYVPGFVPGTTSFPVSTGLPLLSSTCHTPARLGLLLVTAAAQIPTST